MMIPEPLTGRPSSPKGMRLEHSRLFHASSAYTKVSQHGDLEVHESDLRQDEWKYQRGDSHGDCKPPSERQLRSVGRRR